MSTSVAAAKIRPRCLLVLARSCRSGRARARPVARCARCGQRADARRRRRRPAASPVRSRPGPRAPPHHRPRPRGLALGRLLGRVGRRLARAGASRRSAVRRSGVDAAARRPAPSSAGAPAPPRQPAPAAGSLVGRQLGGCRDVAVWRRSGRRCAGSRYSGVTYWSGISLSTCSRICTTSACDSRIGVGRHVCQSCPRDGSSVSLVCSTAMTELALLVLAPLVEAWRRRLGVGAVLRRSRARRQVPAARRTARRRTSPRRPAGRSTRDAASRSAMSSDAGAASGAGARPASVGPTRARPCAGSRSCVRSCGAGRRRPGPVGVGVWAGPVVPGCGGRSAAVPGLRPRPPAGAATSSGYARMFSGCPNSHGISSSSCWRGGSVSARVSSVGASSSSRRATSRFSRNASVLDTRRSAARGAPAGASRGRARTRRAHASSSRWRRASSALPAATVEPERGQRAGPPTATGHAPATRTGSSSLASRCTPAAVSSGPVRRRMKCGRTVPPTRRCTWRASSSSTRPSGESSAGTRPIVRCCATWVSSWATIARLCGSLRSPSSAGRWTVPRSVNAIAPMLRRAIADLRRTIDQGVADAHTGRLLDDVDEITRGLLAAGPATGR